MKKIISFKKELMFKTKVCEITSISLEHVINVKDDDLVSGEFFITGEYKMTEGSINKEYYDFKLPFDIALNSNYDVDSIKLDIDNFYYEILNNEILKVNIDLLIEGIEKEMVPEPIKEIPKENLYDNEERFSKIEKLENDLENIENSIVNNSNVTNVIEKNIEQINIDNKVTNINTNLFDNIGDNETYSTYCVYIVKEEDSIDKILDKYGVTKEDLENYNDITNIKPYDKIIIPSNGK